MANLNINSIKDRTFDAIVIGSGMTGGWAAKELTENGLKTLLLERGKEIKHITDYPTANLMPYEIEHRNKVPQDIIDKNPIASRCHAFTEDKMHLFVKDDEHPYIQDEPFYWFRGYQTGGRSLMWGRMVQRWSDYDFEGPIRDGFAVDWPIRYKDLAPWYSHVEKFIGVSGNRDGIDVLPDGEFLPPFGMTAMEEHLKAILQTKYSDRWLIAARCAHITGNYGHFAAQGRGGCQHRDQCRRGCPLGGYFSSNSSTIPWAQKTGKLTIRHHSVVQKINYDEKQQRATGVTVIDEHTGEETEFLAKIICVNAGSLNTNLLLLNSTSSRFPKGLGNDHELMGKFVGFHNYRGKISGEFEGLTSFATQGRRPNATYIPRFRNVKKQETKFLRGYSAFLGSSRPLLSDRSGIGAELKDQLLNPTYGAWRVGSGMSGETIPKESNRVQLDSTKKDRWGIPLLKISIKYDDNDELMIQDYHDQMEEMYTAAGIKNIKRTDDKGAPGLDIHEMGGVRMGRDPKTSLLNEWNQLHTCPNVLVTDGACMTSTSTQNPSLTYMALTARAINHIVGELQS
ncbi:GMC oxidoreductase [Dyadobacter pollutisoli]|uniref:GMC family oxidoreductase n=1 Tax=Dyadobacter pollutisoli TaxID=2910158 RepID=A0A9E8SP20_9BACT|nr:GMC family oxidoreductase [Dyadobacter pollutisoli]WAC14939.1 GMC family oxidoreductase [Dyadobacter pollutisoli]